MPFNPRVTAGWPLPAKLDDRDGLQSLIVSTFGASATEPWRPAGRNDPETQQRGEYSGSGPSFGP